ncbi:MAG TPA: hypothetical protein VMQ73_18815 [Methylomirabilota bacterium]|nr:hypothetical protein [Methylomirabilota bacterium]
MAKVFKQKTVTFEEAQSMACICAWRGCTATFQGDMPLGWWTMLAFWSAEPIADLRSVANWKRDAVLCPEHARELDGQLKDIGQRLRRPSAGRA